MIINQSFKEAITQNSPRIAFRLTDTITNEVITSIGDGLLIEAPYDFISDSFVGEFPIWKLKAKFMYLENKISYVDHEFLAEIGAYSHDGDSWGEVNWINVGYFRVAEDGQETDDIQKQITLTMYDLGEALDKRYDPLSFPLTGLQIRTQIASRAGLEFAVEQEELLYDDYTFNSINVGAGQAITDREVLRQYAQLNMASGYLDRNGKIIIKSVFNADAVDAEISNYDYSELKLELPYGPLNSLIYSNKAEGDEHSYQDIEAKDQTSITENGKKSLEFSNNIFLDPLTLEEQQLEVDKLFSIINGFSYTPFDLDYFARPDLDPYDLIKIKNMQGDEFFAPLTNMSFNFNGGLIGTLETKELPETLPKNEIPNIFERLDNAEIRVDRVNQKITAIVENIEYLDENFQTRVGQLELTQDGFSTTISNLNEYVDGTFDDIRTEFRADLDGFGQNYVRNLPKKTNLINLEAREWNHVQLGGTQSYLYIDLGLSEMGKEYSLTGIFTNPLDLSWQMALDISVSFCGYNFEVPPNETLNVTDMDIAFVGVGIRPLYVEIYSLNPIIDLPSEIGIFTLINTEENLEDVQTAFRYDAPTNTIMLGRNDNDISMTLNNERLQFKSKETGQIAYFSHGGMYTQQWLNDQHLIKAFRQGNIRGTLWVDKGRDI